MRGQLARGTPQASRDRRKAFGAHGIGLAGRSRLAVGAIGPVLASRKAAVPVGPISAERSPNLVSMGRDQDSFDNSVFARRSTMA